MISVNGKSQYDKDIKQKYRSSACGPVTVSVILNYWFSDAYFLSINELYKKLFTTPIGTFRFSMVRRLRKILGTNWSIKSSNRIDEVINELQSGHPVAAKFDKYFTFRFLSPSLYSYHWVVLIGYEIIKGEIYLYFHDNGGPARISKIRRVLYSEHSSVLRFVLITPLQSKKTPHYELHPNC
ncbi:C39 family peptidase [Domibacillus epiphyticus]|uniref:Peptidase C39-like domain-containing protein n=1 Tax=Domibacillus epiphyticus TaxID=1714355 RepID=A0A1V2ABV1_9BACI|nr:C39 family peptidase [Domibacillus epiphyticus]OMP68471.1 hypothetical protein BTO28_00005 [Domibacillus epiphyticus]